MKYSAFYLGCSACVACALGATTINEKEWQYEPAAPVVQAAQGFHGRAAALERITGADAMGDESKKAWAATAWRNEEVHAQFVVWSADPIARVRTSLSPFTSATGAAFPKDAATSYFVRYVKASPQTRDRKPSDNPPSSPLVGDCLDDAETVNIATNGFRPVWVTVRVPKDAAPGCYTAKLTISGDGVKALEFPLSLTVKNRVLPDPKDWSFNLDFWQHPWAVARYHGVKPFSPEHYALMKPLFRELAQAGQKVITTTITELPWNHQNYDAYGTMVEHHKKADGTWRRDYAIFDEYVAFARACGVGPQIHCYTMATWGHIVYYIDDRTGDKIAVKLVPGTPEHEAFWGDFLRDFEKHVAAKGWTGSVYIALDERNREELQATANCIAKYAPSFKLQLAGNKKPSEFEGIHIDSYAQYIAKSTPEFIAEKNTLRPKSKGFITTYYICCGPAKPNTFTTSALVESRWLGLYAAAADLDGILRWAAFNWPRDPFNDTGFFRWAAGDTFVIYPGARRSARWALLRDSIEDYEKVRVLRAEGKSAAVDVALKNVVYSDKATTAELLAEVEAVRAALDAD